MGLRYPSRCPLPPAEKGVALIVALIMLVVILALGLGALRMTTAEERMTGYTFDRHLAFQAAEAALREIEARVEADRPEVATQCADLTSAAASVLRVCPAPNAAAPPRWVTPDAREWGEATPLGPAGARVPARYLIEHLGSNFACDNSPRAVQTCRQYRITVRAGGDLRAEVMLQSVFFTD